MQVVISILATFFVVGLILMGAVIAMTPAGNTLVIFLRSIFAADSIQIWWYVTRAAGIMAYLMLWFSTILGLAVTSKYLDEMLDRIFTYDFHEFISVPALFTLAGPGSFPIALPTFLGRDRSNSFLFNPAGNDHFLPT